MKKIIKILSILPIAIMVFSIKSFAEVQVQIIPNNKRITNVTVSTSFQTCRKMDSLQSTLGTTSLDPHLATNKDWGAVSYFANSVYGVNTNYDTSNTSQGKVGKEVKITWNGTENTFLSTTGNSSGVMNWGGVINISRLWTQTSGLLKSVTDISDESILKSDDGCGTSTYNNISILWENRNTRYVESIGNTTGMAGWETNGWGIWPATVGGAKKYPVSLRSGLFGVCFNYNFMRISV